MPFVEVTLAGVPGQSMSFAWDTHFQNFDAVKKLSEVLDSGWSTLMRRPPLARPARLDPDRLDGRVRPDPEDQPAAGRDHFPNAWTTVLAGGGIKGGQVIGQTSADGATVMERPVTVPDFLATACLALGHRPAQAEHVRRRPPDPDRRPEGPADQGGAGMTFRIFPIGFALLVATAFATARAEEGTATTTATTTEIKVSKVESPIKPEAPVGDVQDVIFFGDQQPVFIRLHIEAEGKGFETTWTEAMRRLHKYLDTDGDGKLSAQERNKGGWLQRLHNPAPRRGQPPPPPGRLRTKPSTPVASRRRRTWRSTSARLSARSRS